VFRGDRQSSAGDVSAKGWYLMIYVRKRGTISKHMSGYVQASTDNPTGWRPQYQRLGDLHQRPGRVRPRWLGDDAPTCDVLDPNGGCYDASAAAVFQETGINPVQPGLTDAQAKEVISNLVQPIRDANNRILALENAVRQSPAVAQAISQDVIQLRNQYSANVLQPFSQAYSFAFENQALPAGLQGLGAGPLAIGAIVAAVGVISAALYEVNKYLNTVEQKQQVAQTQAQTTKALADQLPGLQQKYTDAVSRGDKTTADATAQQIAAINQNINTVGGGGGGGGSSSGLDFSSFFQSLGIGGSILLGVGVLLFLKK
jgi:uncharacterized membrane protein YgcG